jgi:hypothetical protein
MSERLLLQSSEGPKENSDGTVNLLVARLELRECGTAAVVAGAISMVIGDSRCPRGGRG